MLFTLSDEFQIRCIEKVNPAVQWIFRSDGFMAEVKTEYVFCRMRNHTAEYQCSRLKVLFRTDFLISLVPKHKGARTAFHFPSPCMYRKRGGATRHYGQFKSLFFQL